MFFEKYAYFAVFQNKQFGNIINHRKDFFINYNIAFLSNLYSMIKTLFTNKILRIENFVSVFTFVLCCCEKKSYLIYHKVKIN